MWFMRMAHLASKNGTDDLGFTLRPRLVNLPRYPLRLLVELLVTKKTCNEMKWRDDTKKARDAMK